MEIKRGVICGALGGLLWGTVLFVFSWASGRAYMEMGLVSEALAFALAGTLFGSVVGGFLAVLPGDGVTNWVIRGALVSLAIWGLMVLAGLILGAVEPGRYYTHTGEVVRGFFLIAVLGVIVGTFWKRRVIS
ncbi:MAG: hypothetical protein V3W31_09105 [Thermodesulfobacteriota bacterium]